MARRRLRAKSARSVWRSSRSRWERFFQTRVGTYRTDSLIGFLRHLRRHFRRQRVILLWDGRPGHQSAGMRTYLTGQRHWLTVERLPGYAPDVNPVEAVFGNVKGRELANHCGPALTTLATALRTGLGRVSAEFRRSSQ